LIFFYGPTAKRKTGKGVVWGKLMTKYCRRAPKPHVSGGGLLSKKEGGNQKEKKIQTVGEQNQGKKKGRNNHPQQTKKHLSKSDTRHQRQSNVAIFRDFFLSFASCLFSFLFVLLAAITPSWPHRRHRPPPRRPTLRPPLRSPSRAPPNPHEPRRIHLPPCPHRRTSGRRHAWRT